jgi:hypothetical protein
VDEASSGGPTGQACDLVRDILDRTVGDRAMVVQRPE